MYTVVAYKLEDLKYYISDYVPDTLDAKYDDLTKYMKNDEWLRLHPVQYIVEVRDVEQKQDVETVVFEYMKRHGIQNVRSNIAPFNTVKFDDSFVDELENRIREINVESPSNKKSVIKRTPSSNKLDYCMHTM